MEKEQYSKLISEIPEVDIVITMGCNVQCPFLPCKYREDWELDDPSGKEDEAFIVAAGKIESRIKKLKADILNGMFNEKKPTHVETTILLQKRERG